MPCIDDTVRFDDRLATLLRIDIGTASGRLAMWHQLTAMLGQSGEQLAQAEAARLLAAVAMLLPNIPISARVAAATSIAARCAHPPLAVLLSCDVPSVVLALFDRLNLSPRDWQLILPDLTPLARSRLRARTDLPVFVQRGLESLAPFDLALSASPDALGQVAVAEAPTEAKVGTGSAIADLVERIEAYRNRKPANDEAIRAPNDELSFATDAEGHIRVIDASPRSLFVGISLAEIAHPGATGVDAGVAAAFGKRDHIAVGRLMLAGPGSWSGLWAIQAAPRFAPDTGRFTGYCGSLSRNIGSSTAVPDLPLSGTDRDLAAAMLQMTHELRSPLNAISGFAQLIAGQYFGPVTENYRSIASHIVEDAAFLTSAFEDIDLACRLDTGRFTPAPADCDLAQLIEPFSADTRLLDGDTVALAVNGADAHRLLRLVAHSASHEQRPQAARLVNASVAPRSVELSFERPALEIVPGEPDTMSLDIAHRLATVLGGSVRTAGRKAIVNLPRLLATLNRSDSAG